MPVVQNIQRLSRRARNGLRELPDTASTMVSKALEPVDDVGTAASGNVRDKLREAAVKVADATPVGDSVEARMERARAAAERAEEAEREALESAHEARERAERARKIAKQGDKHVAGVQHEAEQMVEQRTAEARREAEQMIERETADARADADERISRARAEVEQANERALEEASAAQDRASSRLENATEQLADARRLADEARLAAQEAADEAGRHAKALSADADRAEQRVVAAEEVETRAIATTRTAAVEIGSANGSLDARTKQELLDLAGAIDIEGRSTMTKAQLITAIRKAS